MPAGIVTGQDAADVAAYVASLIRVGSPRMDVRAEIVRLELAETFVISRESQDWADVVHVTIAHDGDGGRGEAAPIERYGEIGRVRAGLRRAARRTSSATIPFALEEIGARLAAVDGEQAAKSALDAALHDLQGKLLGTPVNRLLGLPRQGPPTSWTVWLGDPDDMARRAAAAAPRFRRLKLKLGGGDGLDVERVRAVRGVTDLPLKVDVNEWWTLDEALEACGELAALGVEYVEQPLRQGDPGGAELRRRSPLPDLRRRGLPHARRRRRLRGDRARRQHQAREVGRHPRGDPDGARGARARARRDARLHGRVRARDRRRLRGRAALRPRRPRRQPAARPRPGCRGRCSSTASRSPRKRSGLAAGERTLILAEGFSADPHYGKTMRGVLRYRREDVVAILDSDAGRREPTTASRSSATSSRRRSYEPEVALVGVATQGGRFPPAWRALLRGVHPERALARERPPRDDS